MVAKRISLKEFTQIVRGMPNDLRQSFAQGLRDAAHVLADKVREQIEAVDAVDTEALLDSVAVRPGLGGATVVVDAPHAAPVEYGSRPHMPPVQPIEDWGRRKLGREGLGWPVALKIAREGTKPRRYFKRATEAAVNEMGNKIADALDRSRTRGHVVSRSRLQNKLRSALKR